MTDIIVDITEFMHDDLGVDGSELGNEEPLFSAGIIDSFSLVSLLTYIESQYKIRVAPTEVNLDNFDSLARIRAYVESKLE